MKLRLGFVMLILGIDGWGISWEIAPDYCHWQMPCIVDKLTLVQVMARCRQETRHQLSQCYPDLWRHMASLGHNESNTSTLARYDDRIKDIYSLYRDIYKKYIDGWPKHVFNNGRYLTAFRIICIEPTILIFIWWICNSSVQQKQLVTPLPQESVLVCYVACSIV